MTNVADAAPVSGQVEPPARPSLRGLLAQTEIDLRLFGMLLALGLIPYRQADFPFAAIEIAVAAPIAVWWFIRLWQRPTIATLLAGYALTLLAFLFFGRYFQGNYLGFIAAVFTPVPFLATRAVRRVPRRVRRPAPATVTVPRPTREPAPGPLPSPAPIPVALDAAEPSPVGVGSTD